MITYFSPIYRYPSSDCTNNGASSRHDYMTVIEEDQIETFLREKADEDKDSVLVLVRRKLWGEDHWYLRPLIEPEGKVGPMMGGNYANVREVSKNLLPIHDRYETQEEYDILSR